MGLSRTQRGVLGWMIVGASVAMGTIAAGIFSNPFAYPSELDLTGRLSVAAKAYVFLALCLVVSVGRLAKHRFTTPEDIDGSSTTHGTQRASVLQALLQNTLEQALLAALVYLAWSLLLPGDWLSVVPMAAVAFLVGRLLFFAGYRKGAPARALGFALTFYPTVGMLLGVVCFLLWGV